MSPSSLLWKLKFSKGRSRLLAMEVNSFQLSAIVRKSLILDFGKGLGLAKLVFVWQKKPSNSIQKLFTTETAFNGNYKIIFIKAGFSLLLSSKIELSATKVNAFQCTAVASTSSILDIASVPNLPLITISGKVIFNLTQSTVTYTVFMK